MVPAIMKLCPIVNEIKSCVSICLWFCWDFKHLCLEFSCWMLTSNGLILREGKKNYKMVLPLWRVSMEKNVVFTLLKKTREHFSELAVSLSARGMGRRCPFCATSLLSLCRRGQIQEKLEFARSQQRLFWFWQLVITQVPSQWAKLLPTWLPREAGLAIPSQ